MRPLGPLALDLVQVDAELARELAHRRAGVRLRADFLLWLPRHRARRGRGYRRRRACRRPGRRLRRCGRGRRRPRGGSRARGGGRRATRGCGKHEDGRALRDLVADLDLQLAHHALGGRRNLHRRLVGLERDERLLLRHCIARLYQHLDDFDLLEVADVRYRNRGGAAVRAGPCFLLRFLFGFRFGLQTRLRLGGFVLRLELEDGRALRHLVAHLDLDLAHHAVGRRRNLHRRLVGLEGDERLLLGDGIARLDEHLDDGDVLEVSDIRDDDLGHKSLFIPTWDPPFRDRCRIS